MPELPEVETIRQNLRSGIDGAPSLVGQRIAGVSLRWPRHIVKPAVSTFRKQIRGLTVQDVQRRGKFVLIALDGRTLAVHLMMSGDLRMADSARPRGRYDHTLFNFESGWQLRFSDSRKFGRVFLVKDEEDLLGELGPEPLADDFDTASLGHILSEHRRALKPLLMDQNIIAGLGNIYTDEALHRAKLHPLRQSDSLTSMEVQALWEGIRNALQNGLHHNGASIDWVYRGGDFQYHFRAYGRNGEPCPRCGTDIVRTVVGQRGTCFCPACQVEELV
ncbi:MAG: bifunctional DNA-formamidopyrimidine glycosylase/DNA-(apurinic or apyrimidinic site) lyase [Anaerolineales bacterium]